MKQLFSDLIEFSTTSKNPSQINSCFDYVESVFSETPFVVQRFNQNGSPSLIATSQNTKSPKVILQAHLDVVPAKDDFYKLTEKGGKYFGRGVYDMKFAAACFLQLAKELGSDCALYDFGIMFSSDEEIGGENGVKYILDKGYGSQVCILPDGGNDWKIETSSNALWIITVTSDGVSAHGSRPWEGENAINNLIDFINDVHDHFEEQKPHSNSITVSKIHGGEAVNQVPERAQAVLDMRFLNGDEYEENKIVIEKLAIKHDLNIETYAVVQARDIDVSLPQIKDFLEIGESVIGQPINTTHSFGASDACFFAEHNIPTIVIRPPGGAAHSSTEWLDIKGLDQFYEVIKAYIIETTRIKNP